MSRQKRYQEVSRAYSHHDHKSDICQALEQEYYEALEDEESLAELMSKFEDDEPGPRPIVDAMPPTAESNSLGELFKADE